MNLMPYFVTFAFKIINNIPEILMTLNRGEEFKTYLTNHNTAVISAVNKLSDENIVTRIWNKDYTVWSQSPEEISNRLGWLDGPSVMLKAIDEINDFVQEIRGAGFKNALLLGMGGSSLAPEVFRLTFGVRESFLDLAVLDSTHPEAVKSMAEKFNPKETLYIVSTKSGGTVETVSFMKYFFTYAKSKIGEHTPKHFIAITDPGSGLQKMAEDLKFRKIFLNDPNIGGRFSALSYFGLLPAALIGVNLSNLVDRAQKAAETSKIDSAEEIEKNTAATLGVILGELANAGIDKVTFITSPQIKYFGAWLEQLIAESTGKIGKGILPVDLETILESKYYSKDRIFVYLRLKNDFSNTENFTLMREAKIPCVEIVLDDIYDLGAEFFNWEFATSIASWVTGITPFDQPNVEQAKIIGRQKMKDYTEKGELPESKPDLVFNNFKLFGNVSGSNVKEVIDNFVTSNLKDGSYVSIQAYINPDAETTAHLQSFRTSNQKKYMVATTLGYGPRFLHSTGQLHKGDAGLGIFIQITGGKKFDVAVPDEAGSEKSSFSFGVLIDAQAMGDMQALIDNKRNVLRIHIGTDVKNNLKELI